MTNVLQPTIGFHPRQVSHAPSPFGFGFGLGSSSSSSSMTSTSWGASTPGHTNPAAFQQLANSVTQSATSKPQKRRHEDDDENTAPRDDAMDRSPTPERPKRGPPKRVRMLHPQDATLKDESSSKKGSESENDPDVDIGVLLGRNPFFFVSLPNEIINTITTASLPQQSLLPLLTSLINTQPSLKSVILPLIPRPTLETAIQALGQSAKRLREAYPYSNVQPTSHGFGQQSQHSLHSHQQQQHHTGMRDSYIISRLRPHVNDFVSCCMSYLPYFTCVPPSTNIQATSMSHSHSPSVSTIQSLHKDKFHPSETFLFLSAVTNHIINQPPLTISQLSPLILPRLSEEWKTWVDKIDETVNQQGRMFGSETVRTWERGLDEMAAATAPGVSEVMRTARDNWVLKAGWLVGRTMHHAMDEL
ncbi:hypothetical protein CVT24_000444 [Panaeolus cyanescens]|uniref:Tethering factor for nuclear proteasome STS1 n=1 Tax=Panaeolus cyanescens TaxID=181874 RepID=A0A409VDB2_9AGAR|nr:hypothetical protein CVT24_000444 [Panaeolus cyanescens]